MRKLWMAAAVGAALAGPAAAQGLNDAGRLLQQVLPGRQPNPGQSDRDRAIYEQGRRDAEDARRRESGRDENRDPRYDDRRRVEDRPRYDRDQDRRGGDPDRRYDDDRAPRPPGRYQPLDNR